MNINYIRYALEISRCGSINRAAKQLYISQSSLSRGIKELEEEIGIKIFERSSSGISTTHQGEEFLKHASRLEAQYKHLEELYFTGYKPDIFHLSVSSVRYAVACRAVINLCTATPVRPSKMSVLKRGPPRRSLPMSMTGCSTWAS